MLLLESFLYASPSTICTSLKLIKGLTLLSLMSADSRLASLSYACSNRLSFLYKTFLLLKAKVF